MGCCIPNASKRRKVDISATSSRRALSHQNSQRSMGRGQGRQQHCSTEETCLKSPSRKVIDKLADLDQDDVFRPRKRTKGVQCELLGPIGGVEGGRRAQNNRNLDIQIYTHTWNWGRENSARHLQKSPTFNPKQRKGVYLTQMEVRAGKSKLGENQQKSKTCADAIKIGDTRLRYAEKMLLEEQISRLGRSMSRNLDKNEENKTITKSPKKDQISTRFRSIALKEEALSSVMGSIASRDVISPSIKGESVRQLLVKKSKIGLQNGNRKGVLSKILLQQYSLHSSAMDSERSCQYSQKSKRPKKRKKNQKMDDSGVSKLDLDHNGTETSDKEARKVTDEVVEDKMLEESGNYQQHHSTLEKPMNAATRVRSGSHHQAIKRQMFLANSNRLQKSKQKKRQKSSILSPTKFEHRNTSLDVSKDLRRLEFKSSLRTGPIFNGRTISEIVTGKLKKRASGRFLGTIRSIKRGFTNGGNDSRKKTAVLGGFQAHSKTRFEASEHGFGDALYLGEEDPSLANALPAENQQNEVGYGYRRKLSQESINESQNLGESQEEHRHLELMQRASFNIFKHDLEAKNGPQHTSAKKIEKRGRGSKVVRMSTQHKSAMPVSPTEGAKIIQESIFPKKMKRGEKGEKKTKKIEMEGSVLGSQASRRSRRNEKPTITIKQSLRSLHCEGDLSNLGVNSVMKQQSGGRGGHVGGMKTVGMAKKTARSIFGSNRNRLKITDLNLDMIKSVASRGVDDPESKDQTPQNGLNPPNHLVLHPGKKDAPMISLSPVKVDGVGIARNQGLRHLKGTVVGQSLRKIGIDKSMISSRKSSQSRAEGVSNQSGGPVRRVQMPSNSVFNFRGVSGGRVEDMTPKANKISPRHLNAPGASFRDALMLGSVKMAQNQNERKIGYRRSGFRRAPSSTFSRARQVSTFATNTKKSIKTRKSHNFQQNPQKSKNQQKHRKSSQNQTGGNQRSSLGRQSNLGHNHSGQRLHQQAVVSPPLQHPQNQQLAHLDEEKTTVKGGVGVGFYQGAGCAQFGVHSNRNLVGVGGVNRHFYAQNPMQDASSYYPGAPGGTSCRDQKHQAQKNEILRKKQAARLNSKFEQLGKPKRTGSDNPNQMNHAVFQLCSKVNQNLKNHPKSGKVVKKHPVDDEYIQNMFRPLKFNKMESPTSSSCSSSSMEPRNPKTPPILKNRLKATIKKPNHKIDPKAATKPPQNAINGLIEPQIGFEQDLTQLQKIDKFDPKNPKNRCQQGYYPMFDMESKASSSVSSILTSSDEGKVDIMERERVVNPMLMERMMKTARSAFIRKKSFDPARSVCFKNERSSERGSCKLGRVEGYTVQCEIGRGSFARVVKAKHKTTSEVHVS